jgi:hypothetical protein
MINIHSKLEELSLRRQGTFSDRKALLSESSSLLAARSIASPVIESSAPVEDKGPTIVDSSCSSRALPRMSSLPFHYRTTRSHPGCGLYRQFDDCRLLLQVVSVFLFILEINR